MAFAEGQAGVGIAIIIGSNIWNLGMILGISTFAPSTGHGLPLRKEGRDIRLVALYTIGIALLTLLALTLFDPGPLGRGSHLSVAGTLAITFTNLLTLVLFGILVSHALHRFPHASEEVSTEGVSNIDEQALATKEAVLVTPKPSVSGETPRYVVAAVFALLIALGGVIIMVQYRRRFKIRRERREEN